MTKAKRRFVTKEALEKSFSKEQLDRLGTFVARTYKPVAKSFNVQTGLNINRAMVKARPAMLMYVMAAALDTVLEPLDKADMASIMDHLFTALNDAGMLVQRSPKPQELGTTDAVSQDFKRLQAHLLVPVSEHPVWYAAEALNLSEYRLRELIKTGRIKARKHGDGTNTQAQWRISQAEIERVKVERPSNPGTFRNK